MFEGAKKWMGARFMNAGLWLLGASTRQSLDAVAALSPEEDDEDDEEATMPGPVVVLSEEARRMLVQGSAAYPRAVPAGDSAEEGPLAGSAADRILKARAKHAMGNP